MRNYTLTIIILALLSVSCSSQKASTGQTKNFDSQDAVAAKGVRGDNSESKDIKAQMSAKTKTVDNPNYTSLSPAKADLTKPKGKK